MQRICSIYNASVVSFRKRSPEAYPFSDQRRETFYAQAQWQDGGVVHDVKPNGKGISLSTTEHAVIQGEKDLTSL